MGKEQTGDNCVAMRGKVQWFGNRVLKPAIAREVASLEEEFVRVR